MKPLAIDLYCGLGGWTQALLDEGWDVIGFDIEQHAYDGECYPGLLVLQDVRTLHGSQFKDADLIVGSSPCQEFSYRAMPWKRAKALPPPHLGMELFQAQFRIQREASEAAGRYIPMIVENVKGAQPWVGRAPWHYGSYYLWGDIPALMPSTKTCGSSDAVKRTGRTMCFPEGSANPEKVKGRTGKLHWQDDINEGGRKNDGGSWFASGSPGQKETGRNPVHSDGRKAPRGTQWFNDGPRTPENLASLGSKSSARKAAFARIAKIPYALARHIARVYKPRAEEAA